jgi:hypothetical protein
MTLTYGYKWESVTNNLIKHYLDNENMTIVSKKIICMNIGKFIDNTRDYLFILLPEVLMPVSESFLSNQCFWNILFEIKVIIMFIKDNAPG